jgi:FtsH-binding integral membrane protein
MSEISAQPADPFQSDYDRRPPSALSGVSNVAKVYAWLTLAVLISAGSAWLALTRSGTTDHEVPCMSAIASCVTGAGPTMKLAMPTPVAIVLEHPFGTLAVFALLAGCARAASRIRGINILGLVVFTIFAGFYIGPLIYIAELLARAGRTATSHPVLLAFAMAAGSMVTMSLFTLVSGIDCDYWAAYLGAAGSVLSSALIVGYFVHSNTYHLVVISGALLLFMMFVVYDTARIRDKQDEEDPIGEALELYSDLFNIFWDLLWLLIKIARAD